MILNGMMIFRIGESKGFFDKIFPDIFERSDELKGKERCLRWPLGPESVICKEGKMINY